MSLIGTTRFTERVQFFNGQRLFAEDLQAVERFHREMRWLHNQSLHQPGVGSGLAISGPKGSRSVTIDPGYAIDGFGREIVLTRTLTESVPPVADDGYGQPVYFDLTVSYPDESSLDVSETREGICVPRGAIRLREEPVICWVRLGPAPELLAKDAKLREQIQQGLRIILGRARVLNCQLDRAISIAERRNAKPSEQPYVACGRDPVSVWTVPAQARQAGAGVEIRKKVDTSSAEFKTTPCYTARLAGKREFAFTVNGQAAPRVLDGFTSIVAPGPASFEFSVLIPDAMWTAGGPDPRSAADFGAQFSKQVDKQWTIEWMGVEG